MKKERQLHEELKFDRKENPKVYWRKLKETMNWKEKDGLPARVKNQEGNIVTNPEDILSVWETSFTRLASENVQLYDQDFVQKTKNEVQSMISMTVQEVKHNADKDHYELNKEVEFVEVVEVIKRLKKGKAVGNDGIPGELLFQGGEIMWKCIWWISKKIFEVQEIPLDWKKGLIYPIFKKGDRLEPNNYRGITLLSITSKVFSTVLNNRILRFCEKRDVIVDEQAGFRAGRSTVDQVFVLREILKIRKMKRIKTFLVFIDLRKAYDSVFRSGLWKKLHDVGIDGKMWKMLVALYDNNRSAVIIGQRLTNFFKIGTGVKQGCPLSCILFNIFLNSIAEKIKSSGYGINMAGDYLTIAQLLYADDVVLMASKAEELQALMDIFNQEATKWQLSLNTSKTKTMIVGGNNKESYEWKLNGQVIETVRAYAYLGFEITNDLSVRSMREKLLIKAKRAQASSFGICCPSKRLSTTTCLDIWKQLISPHLEFGAEICERQMWKEADRLQGQVAKRILGVSEFASTTAARGELGLWCMQGRRDFLLLKYWHKLVKMEENRVTKKVYRLTREMLSNNHDKKYKHLLVFSKASSNRNRFRKYVEK